MLVQISLSIRGPYRGRFKSKYSIVHIETGCKIQYGAPLRRVAKDHDCLAPYVGADFTEYQRSRVRLESSKTVC